MLRRAAIQSPDYVPGVAGWIIRQDGSVEFNNGVFRGTLTAATFIGTDFIINQAGAFFYAGPPASGNLILALVNAAGTDAFGNAYSGPGISVSAPGAGGKNEIQVRPDLNAILIYAP